MLLSYRDAMMRAVDAEQSQKVTDRGDRGKRDNPSFDFPRLNPKFRIDFSQKPTIFTIGSCFARHAEPHLQQLGANIPTRRFTAPESECRGQPAYLLNEFAPGAISQRISHAFAGLPYDLETLVSVGDLYVDLLFPDGVGVSRERALERRHDVAQLYSELPKADIVLLTLASVESWFDKKINCYLNRMPPHSFAELAGDRFLFRQLDVYDCLPLLHRTVKTLTSIGVKVVLTISPTPLQTTFTADDRAIANEFSKAVLRVCVKRACERNDSADYFPFYEVMRSSGLDNYERDLMNDGGRIVRALCEYFVDAYSR